MLSMTFTATEHLPQIPRKGPQSAGLHKFLALKQSATARTPGLYAGCKAFTDAF